MSRGVKRKPVAGGRRHKAERADPLVPFRVQGASAAAEARLDRIVTVTLDGEKRRMTLRAAIALVIARRIGEALAEGEERGR